MIRWLSVSALLYTYYVRKKKFFYFFILFVLFWKIVKWILWTNMNIYANANLLFTKMPNVCVCVVDIWEYHKWFIVLKREMKTIYLEAFYCDWREPTKKNKKNFLIGMFSYGSFYDIFKLRTKTMAIMFSRLATNLNMIIRMS